jgi:hypothetical protein
MDPIADGIECDSSMHTLFVKPNKDKGSLFIYLAHEFYLFTPFFNIRLIDTDSVDPEVLIFVTRPECFSVAPEEEPQILCNKNYLAVDPNINSFLNISPNI